MRLTVGALAVTLGAGMFACEPLSNASCNCVGASYNCWYAGFFSTVASKLLTCFVAFATAAMIWSTLDASVPAPW